MKYSLAKKFYYIIRCGCLYKETNDAFRLILIVYIRTIFNKFFVTN